MLGCVFVDDHFEVNFRILWSRLMAMMITFVCLSFVVVSVIGGVVGFVYS